MMKTLPEWGVLISQTGSEVITLGKKLGILPSLVITNRITKISEETMKILGENNVTVVSLPNRPTLDQYLSSGLLEKELITLHGYLRILPEELFPYLTGKVYNGHPALISEYPELKGFNKQEDIAGNKEKYPTCGSVIHEVIPELDAGPLVIAVETKNTTSTVDEAYALLRETSLKSWEVFFEKGWNNTKEHLYFTKIYI